jgi:hypothetical protein
MPYKVAKRITWNLSGGVEVEGLQAQNGTSNLKTCMAHKTIPRTQKRGLILFSFDTGDYSGIWRFIIFWLFQMYKTANDYISIKYILHCIVSVRSLYAGGTLTRLNYVIHPACKRNSHCPFNIKSGKKLKIRFWKINFIHAKKWGGDAVNIPSIAPAGQRL